MTEFFEYIKELQKEPVEKLTEHSKRSALEFLLKSIASQKSDKIKVLHEPKRIENYGSPDFLIYSDTSILGYVENKRITENLDKIIHSEQIQKYLELSDNLLLTNYLEFILINVKNTDNGKEYVIVREHLCHLNDIENSKFKPENVQINKVKNLILEFYSQIPLGVSTAKELAYAMAVRAKNLKIFLFNELVRQEKENKQQRLIGLYKTFTENVSSDLTIEQFSDDFAQMLVYGLFLAKLNADTNVISLRNADEFIPQSFQLIRELVSFLKELEKKEYIETKWIIEETIAIMNTLNLISIRQTLSYVKSSSNNELIDTDPYIYFYEDFLNAYNKKLRKAKGVYYTPPQVVQYIISAINFVLKQDFKIKDGLADFKNVTALDFATGTGTFLLEIFKQILGNLSDNSSNFKNSIIKEHLLKNIYGFEYLIAPYTVAHLKLSQFLRDNGYEMKDDERLQVFLTNTIEPLNPQGSWYLTDIAYEGEQSQKIKKKPILIITGNPPYSISSSNKNPETLKMIEEYKLGLDEQKINLDDDYIKFIRFAQEKMNKSEKGVIGIITNNSYLDGITHRKMRETLFNDFDKIYIINLHGNSIKKEGDQNVFDIRVGVSIIILIKFENPLKDKEVYYFSTKDHNLITREQKFEFLQNTSINNDSFVKLNPDKPFYWFVNKDFTNGKYLKYWSITSIFNIFSVGIGTKVDKISIDFDKQILSNRIKDILENKYKLNELINKFKLNDRTTWEYSRAIKAIYKDEKIVEYDYRPFDKRKIFYDKQFLSRSRSKVMDNFINKSNIGLEVGRTNFVSFISKYISDEHFGGPKSYKLPLYIYLKNQDGTLSDEKVANFTEEFNNYIANKYIQMDDTEEILKIKKTISNEEVNKTNIENLIEQLTEIEGNEDILQTLNIKLDNINTNIQNLKEQIEQLQTETSYFMPSPESILAYIYAILNSNVYRNKYLEYLKIDFPRILFTDSLDKFNSISALGQKLVNIHLLDKNSLPDKYNNLGQPIGSDSFLISKVQYNNERIYFADNMYFDNVKPQIWEFEIGSYQVLDHWLKSRKGKILDLDEVTTYQQIIQTIAYTLDLIEEIDIEVLKIL